MPDQKQAIHTRTNRFFRQGKEWFFSTRDGNSIGPFTDKAEAQLALAYFVERTQWPNKKQLREYSRSEGASPNTPAY